MSQEAPQKSKNNATPVPQLHRSEETLFQSEESYKLLVDSVIDYAIFFLDRDGYIQSWNQGAKRIKGYSAEEIIGKHFSTFYTEEDIARQHPQEELEIATKTGRFEEEGWR